MNPRGTSRIARWLLHEDWHYGLPLLRDLVSQSKNEEAEGIFEKTMASLLGARWEPEKSLLISVLKLNYFHGSPRDEVISLLKDWTSTAGKVGKKERAASLQYQLLAFSIPDGRDSQLVADQ